MCVCLCVRACVRAHIIWYFLPACSVIVIVLRNGHSDTSSIPGRD